MPDPLPTVGRVVLVRGIDGEVRPGLVSRVLTNGNINVCPSPGGYPLDSECTRLMTDVEYDQSGAKPGSWAWMPYQLAPAQAKAPTPVVPASTPA